MKSNIIYTVLNIDHQANITVAHDDQTIGSYHKFSWILRLRPTNSSSRIYSYRSLRDLKTGW